MKQIILSAILMTFLSAPVHAELIITEVFYDAPGMDAGGDSETKAMVLLR